MSLADTLVICRMTDHAKERGDWPGVLRWESRLDEMLSLYSTTPEACAELVKTFACANMNQALFAKAASLFERSAELLGNLERFRDQARDVCQVGQCFFQLGDGDGATPWFERARKVGAAHGFFQA